MNHSFIYHLVDFSGQVRYVGVSINPYGRFLSHRRVSLALQNSGYLSEPHRHRFYRWLKSELLADRPVEMVIVAIAGVDRVADETAEIKRQLALSAPLLNTVILGEPSEAQRSAWGVRRAEAEAEGFDSVPRSMARALAARNRALQK